MIKARLLLPLCFLFATPALGQRAPEPLARPLAADTYIYSDLCVGANGYDVRGHRVVLRLGPVVGNESVFIEFSEFGADIGPLRSYRVNFDDAVDRADKTNHLEFSYQTQDDEYTFSGTVSPDGDRLTGNFDDDNRPVTLPRVSAQALVKPRCANE